MSVPHLLITRPRPAADETARRWKAAGFTVSVFPLLDIHIANNIKDTILHELNLDISCIISTSRNVIPLLAEIPAARTLPLAVVGKASADLARRLGFRRVLTGGGTAAALAERLSRHFSPSGGTLLYLRGREISADIAADLRETGFTVHEIIAYEARAATALPAPLQARIRAGRIHAAAAYSRRSLRILERLIAAHSLSDAATRMTLVCFSAAIAEEADRSLWERIETAESPCEAAMLEVFIRLYGTPPHIG